MQQAKLKFTRRISILLPELAFQFASCWKNTYKCKGTTIATHTVFISFAIQLHAVSMVPQMHVTSEVATAREMDLFIIKNVSSVAVEMLVLSISSPFKIFRR